MFIEDEEYCKERITWNLERIASGEEPLKVFPPAYFGAVELGLLDLIPEEYRPTKEDFPEAFERYEEYKATK
jgi:hypothetical protein